MATTKTTASKSKSVLGDINKTVKQTSKVNDETANITIDANEMIRCTSITFGELIWVSPKTNILYRWYNYGEDVYLPYSEIEQMFSASREFVTKPYFIIQDDRIIDKFRLIDVYSKVVEIQQLEDALLNDINKARNIFDKVLEYNMRDVIISKLRDMRRNGKLSNIDVLNMIEEKVKIDLSRSE